MADGLIKKIFSFARKSGAAEAAAAPEPEAAAPEAEPAGAADVTPFEAWRAEQQAKAAQQEQAALRPAAARRPAAPRAVDESGLIIRPEGEAQAGRAGPAAAPESAAKAPQPWLARLTQGMAQSSRRLNRSLSAVFTGRKLDEAALEELEDILLQADLGLETATKITDRLRAGRFNKNISAAEIRAAVADEIRQILQPCAQPLELDLSHKPHIILVVGVNGSGKTTTIGKLAAKLRAGGLSVMLAAGDTFRAAAIEQLHIWGQRTGAPVISSSLGADAASLVFDAYQQAAAAGSDVLLIDTAGRLHNKTELMAELAKLVRVLQKQDPTAPHTVLQNLDATTGQNALTQVEIFKKTANVTGLVMTKLDGTARGGILAAIAAKYKLPIYFIGVGEDIADLEPFSVEEFAEAIIGEQ